MPAGIAPGALEDDGGALAAAVLEELARRRLSRRRLADQAKISVSTLEKALAGRRPFTLATTVRLEQALGVRLRRPDAAPPPSGEVAPEELGSYSRRAARWIEGAYLTLRPSFAEPDGVAAYRTEIAWDEAASCLAFRESDRLDAAFTQHGVVSMPSQSGHIYLVTNRHGQYRTIVLSRPTVGGEMYGVLTTLIAGRGSQLTPAAAPIALLPLAGVGDPVYGRISPGDRRHGAYRASLRRAVEEPFAVFLPG